MAIPPRRTVREWTKPTNAFKRSVRRLDARQQRELTAVLDELTSDDELPSGRRYEQVFGGSMRSIRLSQQFRFIFWPQDDGAAIPVAVGPHDDAYDDAERWWKRALSAKAESDRSG